VGTDHDIRGHVHRDLLFKGEQVEVDITELYSS